MWRMTESGVVNLKRYSEEGEGDIPLHAEWRYINAGKANVKVPSCRVVRENEKGGSRARMRKVEYGKV